MARVDLTRDSLSATPWSKQWRLAKRGHGPPACVPGEGEETPATLPPSQNSQPSGSEAPANDTDMGEDELQALASSLQVASEVVTDGREKIFQDVQARYSKILYTPTKDEFVKTSREELANNQRALILIDCPASRRKINAELIDMASQLVRMTSHPPRILVTVNRRFDLMSGVNEKLTQALPKYMHFCVPVTSKRQEGTLQSLASQEFVFVSVPPEDKRGVPASATTGYAKQIEKLRLRCMDRRCKHRSAGDRQALPEECADVGEEINPEDKDDPMADMLAAMVEECEAEEGDVANAAAAEEGAEQMLQEVREQTNELKAQVADAIKKKVPINREEAQALIGKNEVDLINLKVRLETGKIRQAYDDLKVMKSQTAAQKEKLMASSPPDPEKK